MAGRAVALVLVGAGLTVGCSSGDDVSPSGPDVTVAPSDDVPVDSATPTVPADFVADIRPAIDAVEAELGGPQQYFEVTANGRFVNVFVAVDDATAAVPYLYVDGDLQPPAPAQEGASGNTFAATDLDFDEATLLDRVADELPNTQIEALSVYGDGVGATYVVGGRSSVGGMLDIVITSDGAVVSVDPI